MSTKSSIRHGKRWHLYQECFESDGVYLNLENVEINVSADGNTTNVTIRLDNELSEEIGITTKKERPTKLDWDKITNFSNKK